MARRPTPRPGAAAAQPSPRELLVNTWFGRLFIAAAAVKFVVALWRLTGALPAIARLVSGAATIGLAIALGVFAWRLFVQIKRRLLWRVRRKLILSYIFIGVIPSLLILVFFLFAGSLVFMNVSAYLFRDGYESIVENARLSAQAAATGIARNPATAVETIQRVHEIRSAMYPAISVAYLAPGGRRETAGPWLRQPVPQAIPSWVWRNGDVFTGLLATPIKDSDGEEDLVVRAVVRVAGGTGGAVVVDIPLDEQVMHRLHDSTGVRLENVYDARVSGNGSRVNKTPGQGGGSVLFERSLTQLDIIEWDSPKGNTRRDTAVLTYRLRELYNHLSSAQSLLVSGDMRLSDALLLVLVLIGVMFLIIEVVALVMGLALARSITSSVHELFMGTERVRQGDFTHRINIASRDQLGELADSFNQMTGSIENLLQTAAEKKRLEEELRIARQIQMSLLPRGPLDVPGLGVTALCVPAREVGGDYYDFFTVGARRLGVLIADVSGKGTSAALYMAELKGLMLSLSQIYQSPRQLLIEVNRIISENLDTRSFITMMYAVIDLEAGVMTFARAGHTPLMYVPAGSAAPSAQVLVPNGLVVGLRIPGAHEKFTALLEEDRIELGKGDVLVFYTDGITEAMNQESDLFGDARLGRLLAEHGHLDAADLRERILREIESFVGTADQHDDMTMILLKVEQTFAAAEKVAV
ncbi:MAG TPA: SpoIIE family protein phosphatase [Vicinamibacterales bacterium]|nr:SpoIIE family protein phosphatase [Vicinamibacterales bacterium]